MASMRDIKRRRESIQSTGQITKAMKLVSTVKLQKAKNKAENTKPYFEHMYKAVNAMLAKSGNILHPYLESGKSEKKGIIVVTSNRLNQAITDKGDFSTVAWVMTIGSCLPLVLMPILCKKLHSKIGGALSGDSKIGKLGDYISAGAFIGIITAFVATSINGKSSDGKTDGGFLSIAVLIVGKYS